MGQFVRSLPLVSAQCLPIINNSYLSCPDLCHRFKMAPHEQDSIPTEAIAAPSFKIVGTAMEIPLVNEAVEAATKLHNEAVTYPYVNQVETILGGLITKAEDTISPCVSETISSKVHTTAAQLDTLACTGLDQVTAQVPALKLPTGELATATTTATLTLANTVLNYVLQYKVARLLATVFTVVLGLCIKGVEAGVGLLEGKADMCPATINTVVGVVKPIIGHVGALKSFLEEHVKANTPVDLVKPVEEEKPKEE